MRGWPGYNRRGTPGIGRGLLAGSETYFQRLKKVFGNSIISYFPIDEPSGTVLTDKVNGYNGTYANVTLNQPGYKGKSGLWGATSFANIRPAALNLNVNEGTFMFFINVTEINWKSATQLTLLRISYGASVDYFSIYKSSVHGKMEFVVKRNGSAVVFTSNITRNPNWIHVAFTYSMTSGAIDCLVNAVKCYEPNNVTGLIAHSGEVIFANAAGLGSIQGDSAITPWIGKICHFTVLNKVAAQSELETLLNINQLIFDGDSRTANTIWPIISIGGNLVSPRNVAVSGHGIDLRTAAISTAITAKMRANKKNIVAIWAGVNNHTLTAAQIFALLQTYCQTVRAANPAAKIIVFTEIDAQDAARNTWNWHTKYIDLNTLIKNGYSSFADACVDLGANTNLQDATNTTYFLADKVHLTADGYSEVANTAAPVINQLINT